MDQLSHVPPPGHPLDAHGNPIPAQMTPGHHYPPHHGPHNEPNGICHGVCCRGVIGARTYYPYSYAAPFSEHRRKRTAYNSKQVAALEEEYAKNSYLDAEGRLKLAERLGLYEPQLKVWFQNRRARERRENPEGEERLADYYIPKNTKILGNRSMNISQSVPASPKSIGPSPRSRSKKFRNLPGTRVPSDAKSDHWIFSLHKKMSRYDLNELTKISERFQEEYKRQPVQIPIKVEEPSEIVVKEELKEKRASRGRRSQV